MDTSKLSNFTMSLPPRDVKIVDARGEKIGLTITIVSDTDQRYIKVRDKVQQRMNSTRLRGRIVKPAEHEELERELAAARISGIKVSEPFKSAIGEIAFNKANAIALLYEHGEFSASVRKQVDEAARSMADDFLTD